ncbi:MAG TPA: M20/M25/M40 family metallo-hydrolase [Vicinamibacterales bacterium]|nr:M20/M25/M40 family metallo-hydrolase [Vicinamibacterales bacterium]
MTRREALQSLGAALAVPYLGQSGVQPNAESLSDIHKHVEGHYSDHLKALRTYIQRKSISSENVGVRECAEMLVEDFGKLGCREAHLVETDGFPVAWGLYDVGAPRTLVVYSLYDVVHVVEKEWSSPPFEARVVPMKGLGKAVVGRGAVNSKGPFRALLNAMESVIAIRKQLPLNVAFVIEGEEELGSPHLPQFFAKQGNSLKGAHGCLTPGAGQNLQGNVVVSLGNRGLVYLELEASGSRMKRGPKKFDLSSYQQTIVESPVWRLVEALSTMTEKSGTRPRIEELNRAVAPLSNEDQDLVAALLTSFDPDKTWKQMFAVEEFADGLSGKALLERQIFAPSLCIDGIWAGYTGPGVATLMPQKATAKLDYRLVPGQDFAKAVPAIKRHLAENGFADIDVRVLSGYNWSRTSPKAQIVQSLVRTYRKAGFDPLMWPMGAAANPSYLFTEPPLSIPKIGGGLGHGARQHSVDEYLVVEGEGRIAGLVEAEKFYVDFLYDFARS